MGHAGPAVLLAAFSTASEPGCEMEVGAGICRDAASSLLQHACAGGQRHAELHVWLPVSSECSSQLQGSCSHKAQTAVSQCESLYMTTCIDPLACAAQVALCSNPALPMCSDGQPSVFNARLHWLAFTSGTIPRSMSEFSERWPSSHVLQQPGNNARQSTISHFCCLSVFPSCSCLEQALEGAPTE